MLYYVYVYSHPITKIPFYVGKGCKGRYRRHLNETLEQSTNKFRWTKIQSLRNEGLEPIIEFAGRNLSNDEALELETSLIRKYGKIIEETGSLTNILDGGSEPPKGVGNPDWKTNNPSNYVKGISYEDRYGSEKAAYMRRIRSGKFPNKKMSDEGKKSLREHRKAVGSPHLNKRIMTPGGTFESMTEAAKYYNVSPGTITYRVNSTAERFASWSYLGDGMN